MLNKLQNFIQKHQLILTGDRLLLAVSGGKDSVAMAHLLTALNFDFAIAHCNYKLRGVESDQDQLFVKDLAQILNVPFYHKHFETKKYSTDYKLSIQMAARDLRYQWFNQILQENNFNKIVTAHHLDDSIETLLIKKSRKASLEGLRGILPLNGNIIRPLLCFNSQEIIDFLKSNNFKYREDSSNKSSNYQRNYIRNVSLPALELDQTNIRELLLKEIDYNQKIFEVLQKDTSDIKNRYFYSIPFGFRLEMDWINKHENHQEIIYQILKNFGSFNWKDVFGLINADNGKWVFNNRYRIIKERKGLEISLVKANNFSFFVEQNDSAFEQFGLKFEKIDSKDCIFRDQIHFLDFEKLRFPLELRSWKKGDKFEPFGMNGTKKVSDFLIDLKCSTLQKENALLLCSAGKIVAIIGYRINEQYKIDKKTKFALKISFN